jgi:hypothetical protein
MARLVVTDLTFMKRRTHFSEPVCLAPEAVNPIRLPFTPRSLTYLLARIANGRAGCSQYQVVDWCRRYSAQGPPGIAKDTSQHINVAWSIYLHHHYPHTQLAKRDLSKRDPTYRDSKALAVTVDREPVWDEEKRATIHISTKIPTSRPS